LLVVLIFKSFFRLRFSCYSKQNDDIFSFVDKQNDK